MAVYCNWTLWILEPTIRKVGSNDAVHTGVDVVAGRIRGFIENIIVHSEIH